MAGTRAKPNRRGGKFQGWYLDATGKRRFFSGTTNRKETLDAARQLESEARLVALGVREPQTGAARNKARPFDEVVKEYLTWGMAQGGRRGYGWAARHGHYRKTNLEWWGNILHLETLADLDGILPKAEKALIELGKTGLAPKSLRNTAESLKAFSKWAEDRNYLDGNPVKRLGGFSSEPQSQKRLFTLDEIKALLNAAPPERALVYQTAATTGLRVSELRALKVSDLNLDAGCLNIRAAISKSRRPAMLPIPTRLRELLSERAAGLPFDASLLAVPGNAQSTFETDRKHAGIVKLIPGQGVACFHGLRIFYITTLLESGASAKEAMTLARHGSLAMTMDRYARTRPARLANLVEQTGKAMEFEEKCVTRVLPKVACLASGQSKSGFMVGDAGFEPATSTV